MRNPTERIINTSDSPAMAGGGGEKAKDISLAGTSISVPLLLRERFFP
jgi:hypothetical protein